MELHEEINELEQRFADSPDSRLFLPLADSLRRAGELERAVKLCRDGLERFPDFGSARVLLGECLTDMGELEQAGRVLEEAALQDGGNRRIAGRLADIARQGGDDAELSSPVEPGSGQEAAVVEPAGQPSDKGSGKHKSEAGEMFITHTLGDIYKMQGHDRKAFEVYSKLVAEGHADQEVSGKLKEMAERLGENLPGGGQVSAEAPGETVMQKMRAESGEGRFEERIDTIFHFLLGDSPEHAELEHSSRGSERAGRQSAGIVSGGSGEFVDMLEDWIDDIRQGK
ncbi:tetratricopeptide repeat protein [Gemmatimonadota bacterium]